MFQKSALLLLSCLAVFSTPLLKAADNIPGISYPDQNPPGDEARLFAPHVVSNGFNNRDVAMMPDGSEFYFAVNMRNFDLSTILTIRKLDDGWSEPEVALFASDQNMKYLEPAISPDGSRFFYVASTRDDGNNNDIWMMERMGAGWGSPVKLGNMINTPVGETFPSITNDGTLYFSRVSDDPRVEHIYRSRFVDGAYLEAERLPDNVNCGKTQFNAFVAPDESYLIVSVYGREDSIGSIDYYIVYRNADDQWSDPINMGEKINTEGAQEYSAFVSRDDKYLFFMSTRLPDKDGSGNQPYSMETLTQIYNSPENGNSDIYWIDAGIIEELRPEGF
jgi:hypothetical protein